MGNFWNSHVSNDDRGALIPPFYYPSSSTSPQTIDNIHSETGLIGTIANVPKLIVRNRLGGPNTYMNYTDIHAAQRKNMIDHHLPIVKYDEKKIKQSDCAICLIDFEQNQEVRQLPCSHVYHQKCIDQWLLKQFICPSCLTNVDAALLLQFVPKS
ncbi:unnamed protein product [Didymodactylos carnosus]|uniref:RING-type domain-containing protein n=1 Tax=Didymodactylos carnosus TaxID=1234261 RepID=A0A813SBB2_9BILA|nr:unnamed protein product [Didymodactylos carnosus]CAF0792766.1 unnamed protein product [Didymodactylos carnosus]CAF3564382.1 unnamed protein product [Didymodactylos carnosus]CAF3577120.1 unnamed protein product [Didymodactylos carnosus]